MSSTLQPQVRVGVGVFILFSTSESKTNPKFLIGKRKGSLGAGTYALPGGHLEFSEDLETCASREVLEETGLIVTDVRFLTAVNTYMPEDNKHYITVFMVCVREGEGREPLNLEPEKCEGWEWVSWEDLLRWAGENGGGAGDGERTLFTPLLSLLRQRPGVIPANQ